MITIYIFIINSFHFEVSYSAVVRAEYQPSFDPQDFAGFSDSETKDNELGMYKQYHNSTILVQSFMWPDG